MKFLSNPKGELGQCCSKGGVIKKNTSITLDRVSDLSLVNLTLAFRKKICSRTLEILRLLFDLM